jgi:uncharacterized protein YecT (DUF1311 family)
MLSHLGEASTMNRRDRIAEIQDIKQRHGRVHEVASFSLGHLKGRWEKSRTSEACTPDFYVIKAVTLLEVFARANIRKLIDHGGEYTKRAVELSRHLKIDFNLVLGIQDRAITLGDILAHSVPLSSFTQVLAQFETLLGKTLQPLLTKVVNRFEAEIENKPATPIIGDFDLLARTLTRLYEVRHILCHEGPRHAVYRPDELEQFLEQAIQFAKALEEVVTFDMFGLVPLTQADMNIAADQRLRKKEDELNELTNEVRDSLAIMKLLDADGGNWLSSFDDVQQKWLTYRNAQCEFDTLLNKGGTIRPLLWAQEATQLTEARIAYLRAWLEREAETRG